MELSSCSVVLKSSSLRYNRQCFTILVEMKRAISKSVLSIFTSKKSLYYVRYFKQIDMFNNVCVCVSHSVQLIVPITSKQTCDTVSRQKVGIFLSLSFLC